MKFYKGFTLLETLVAFILLGITLSIIFSILSEEFKNLEKIDKNLKAFLALRNALFSGNTEGVKVMEKSLEEYGIRVRILKKEEIELIEVD